MYNILTCDDEQIVLDSLKFIFDKNFEGQVNVIPVLSGAEAIQAVTKDDIDIVFMDINMPGMSGLDTIRCILNLKPSTVIIVLSAFDKFQYAQEAMNLGAYKYLTKPFNRNVVIQTVRNAMNVVDSRHGKENDDELQKKLDIVSPMVESDFIYSCIFNADKKEDLSTYMDYFNLNVKRYFFVCLEVPKVSSKNQMEIYNNIKKTVNSKFGCLIGSFMVNRLVMFVSVENDDFRESAKSLYSMLSFNISQGIRCGVSKVSDDLSEVTKCYNDALSALNVTAPNGELLFAQDLSSRNDTSEKLIELQNRLFARLKLGDCAGVSFIAGLLLQELSNSSIDMNKIKGNVFEILINAKTIAQESNPHFENNAFAEAFSVLASTDSIESITVFLQNRLIECASTIYQIKESKENPVVKKATQYILDHVSEDISLEDTAVYAGVSSFYLSKLFKEEIGETFINYLTDRRLEKARSLLLDTEFSIKEITAECGYNDQNYFSRLFKNKFGLSPSDYRSTK